MWGGELAGENLLTTPCRCAIMWGLRLRTPGWSAFMLASNRAMLAVQLRMYLPTCSSILSRSTSLQRPGQDLHNSAVRLL